MTFQSYDLIGDIHGYSGQLNALLQKLGYRKHGAGYRHPERKVIFLGDFVDRGPGQREVVDTVRAMADDAGFLHCYCFRTVTLTAGVIGHWVVIRTPGTRYMDIAVLYGQGCRIITS